MRCQLGKSGSRIFTCKIDHEPGIHAVNHNGLNTFVAVHTSPAKIILVRPSSKEHTILDHKLDEFLSYQDKFS